MTLAIAGADRPSSATQAASAASAQRALPDRRSSSFHTRARAPALSGPSWCASAIRLVSSVCMGERLLRHDVLVEVEHVRRVVAALERDQPLVLRVAVRGPQLGV